MKKIFYLFLFSEILFIAISPNIVLAQDCETCCDAGTCESLGLLCLCNPLEWDTIEDVIEGIIDFIFVMAIVLAPLMIIIGAFFFITSGGNPDKIRTAKNIILYTIIGFAIVLFAMGLVSVVLQIIGG